MRIATLITNTDFSDFARARPHDGEKFRKLIREVRPNWHCSDYWVCRDEFPEGIGAYDGLLITGSPASVNDGAPWIARLEELVRNTIAIKQPLFGACFGHQLIAKVLGASIIRNPMGWGHGLLEIVRTTRFPWSSPADSLRLYGSHIEQVETVPAGAQIAFEGDGLSVAGFAVDEHVFTVQHHPEMSHEFICDLVEHYAGEVGPHVTEAARRSLAHRADREMFAGEIARFFEHASSHWSR